jgi:hypothetical protein
MFQTKVGDENSIHLMPSVCFQQVMQFLCLDRSDVCAIA